VLSKGTYKEWIKLEHKGKEAGQIMIEMIFESDSGATSVTTTTTEFAPPQMHSMTAGVFSGFQQSY
jgi:hypothetical protein